MHLMYNTSVRYYNKSYKSFKLAAKALLFRAKGWDFSKNDFTSGHRNSTCSNNNCQFVKSKYVK